MTKRRRPVVLFDRRRPQCDVPGAWTIEQRCDGLGGWIPFGPQFETRAKAEAFRVQCLIPGVLELRLVQVGAEQLELIEGSVT